MSKILTVVFMILSSALIVFNIIMIDFNNPLEGDSIIAFIGIVASLCAIAILLIFMTSKRIHKKVNEN